MQNRWKTVTLLALLILAGITTVAAITGVWVLTAIPIGFLFGVFLEKSDLCGSSAFSEVILTRDPRKVGGLWVAIAVSMAVFSAGSLLGWIQLSPKPFIWANYLVGGVAFGVGIVLAGGCVSGCLFKAGQGNINSMAGLVGIPIGVAAVAYGPLKGLNTALKAHVITASGGKSVTLSTVTGLPYWVLAVAIGLITLAAGLWLAKRGRTPGPRPAAGEDERLLQRIVRRPWKPWQSGIAIGVLGLLAFLSSAASGRNYPLGVTHGVLDVLVLATDYPVDSVWTRNPAPAPPIAPVKAAEKTRKNPRGHHGKHVLWWMLALVVSLVAGSHTSSKLRGSFHLKPKPPDETIIAFLGGILLGAGAAIASGCVIGNILSGVALMSVGNILFAVVVILANWATTYLYMMGGGAEQTMGSNLGHVPAKQARRAAGGSKVHGQRVTSCFLQNEIKPYHSAVLFPKPFSSVDRTLISPHSFPLDYPLDSCHALEP